MDDVLWVRRLAETGAARAIREASLMSGPEMSAKLAVSASTLSRWERGVRRPRPAAAQRWAELLRKLGA